MRTQVLQLVLIVWFCGTAHADPLSPGTPVKQNLCLQDDICRQHSMNAKEFSKAGNLREAIVEYEAAYQEIQLSVFLYNIGRLHHRLGELDQAATYYNRYLSTAIDEDPEQRARANEYLREIQVPKSSVEPVLPTPALVEKPAKKPFYKTWWFWTITGTVVAGAAIGVGVGLGIGATNPNRADIMLYTPAF